MYQPNKEEEISQRSTLISLPLLAQCCYFGTCQLPMLSRYVSLSKQRLLRDSVLNTEDQVSYRDTEETFLDVEHGKARMGHLFSIPFLISNFPVQVGTTTIFPIL